MEKIDILSIDGQKLRILASIYETGSISKTAELFDLNQSTISHTLDRLRAAIGDPLFVKAGRGITPTEKTFTIMPRVLQIVGEIEGLAAAETYDPAQDTKPFVLAISTPALLQEMQAIYHALRKHAPNMRLDLRRLAPREALPEMLATNEIDMAISFQMENFPSVISAAPLQDERLVVFYDPKVRGPIESVEDYGAASHATVSFGGNTRSIVESELVKRGFDRKVAFVAPTASMLGDFIVGTDLIATMPSRLAGCVYHELAYCEPPITFPKLHYHLVWRRRGEHSGRNLWLRKIVFEATGLG